MSPVATRAAAAAQGGPPAGDAEGDVKVTPLELFFDLVFVFAITQVTTLLAEDPTWAGLVRGLLMLAVLWWAWVGYAWLTNHVDPEEGATRLAMFAAAAAMLVASLAVPRAFGREGVVFGVAYLGVRALQLVLFALAARDDDDRELLGAVARLAVGSTIGPALILLGTAFDGGVQIALWAAAVVVDFGGAALIDPAGWRLAPSHFAERHGLIVIIAIGECIVSVGVGVGGHPLDAGILGAAVLAVAVTAALWWAYFDVVAIVAERKLRSAVGAAQNAQARDSYSFLHLPMIAGIVLFALGVKKTLGHVDDPLAAVVAAGLCGGIALYLLGHVGFRWRNMHTISPRRLVAAALLLGWIPIATTLPAVASLGWVALVSCALIAYEAIRFREARDRLRHSLAR